MADFAVKFLDHRQPSVDPGDYTLKVEQRVELDAGAIAESFEAAHRFSVLGPRFTLDPHEIQEMFPPPGSLGNHSNALPHIIFKRSTLPWERHAAEHDKTLPWLALLLFDEHELPPTRQRVETLAQLRASPFFKELPRESGDHDDDQVTVIDVAADLLRQCLPTEGDLKYLAHVRQSTRGADARTDEVAVIIGNRLPKSGRTSVVHLVSLEHRYPAGASAFEGAAPVSLVSLKSWRFSCVSPKHTFKGLLEHLGTGMLRLPAVPESADPGGVIEAYFKRGAVPLAHAAMKGDRTVAWYHGPLTPGENRTAAHVELPIRSAGGLLLKGRRDDMRDVSYAAAWELGRLLTVQKTQVAVDLFNWKRAHAHDEHVQEAEEHLVHLPYAKAAPDLAMPASVTGWFDDLARLHGVPFSYLVPDERMLPAESIRFFWVDWRWVECLLDGAFSVGRATGLDHRRDQGHAASPDHARPLLEKRHAAVTGCMLRSDLVSGWPGLRVRGYDGDTAVAPLRDAERLSKNVSMCLFAGKVTRVDIEQEEHTLHFGFDRGAAASHVEPIFRGARDNNVVDVGALAAGLLAASERSSARFAMRMIEPGEGASLQSRY